MKKFLALSISLVMVLAAFTGCGAQTPPSSTPAPAAPSESGSTPEAPAAPAAPAGAKLEVAQFVFNFSDPQQNAVKNNCDEIFKSMGNVNATFYDAADSQATQNDQIDNAIQKGVNLLIVGLKDVSAAQTVVDKAKAAGLPILFYNVEPPTDVLKTYDKANFIGTDPNEAGVRQGDIVAKLFEGDNYAKLDRNGNGTIDYVMIRADLSHPEANGRTQFSVEQADKLLKAAGKGGLVRIGNTDLLAEDWSTVKGKEQMEIMMTSNPVGATEGAELVLCNNDGIAIGAVEALNAKGWNLATTDAAYDAAKYVPVIGVDAIPQAKDAIDKGRMAATVTQDAKTMATYITTVASNLINGKAPLDGTDWKFDEGTTKLRMPYGVYPENLLG